jgi:hypothetical protein
MQKTLILGRVAEQDRGLGEGEDEGQPRHAPDLERHPVVGRERPAEHLVEHRERDEEDNPVACQLRPSGVVQPGEGVAEDEFEQRAPGDTAKDQDAASWRNSVAVPKTKTITPTSQSIGGMRP